MERVVTVYVPRLVAGAITGLVGSVLVPPMIPVIVVAGLIGGTYLGFLSRRRWKHHPTQTPKPDAVTRRPILTILAPAIPEALLAVAAFVGAFFAADGARFGLATGGGALCGAMIGVASGRLSEFDGRNVAAMARRIWFV